jgi:hypothetical protein
MQQRAAWMLALAGVIFGLGATQARETLIRAPLLGPDGEDIAALTLTLGLASVMVSAIFALLAVLPQPTWLLDKESRNSLYERVSQVESGEKSEYDINKEYVDFVFTRLSHDFAGYQRLEAPAQGGFRRVGDRTCLPSGARRRLHRTHVGV